MERRRLRLLGAAAEAEAEAAEPGLECWKKRPRGHHQHLAPRMQRIVHLLRQPGMNPEPQQHITTLGTLRNYHLGSSSLALSSHETLCR
jgi:hypothetical protein